MTTHQDTSTERERFEAWASDDGKWPQAVERRNGGYKLMKTECDWIAWQAALASRDEAAQQPQGQPRIEREDIIRMAREAGIEVHDRKQQARFGIDALLGLDSTDKLQRFADLVTAAERNKAAQQPQGQAVSDEQIDAVLPHETGFDGWGTHAMNTSDLRRICRAILALRDKPAPTLINGLTEAETSASASVSGLVQRVPLSNCAWEVRIAGPDDVHTLDTEIDALRQANEVNKAFVADCLNNPGDYVLCVATVHGITAHGAGGEPT